MGSVRGLCLGDRPLTMTQYECPLEQCDYAAGTVGSVKGHITAKSDSVHQGERGPDYTDEIEGTIDASSADSSTESTAETAEQGAGIVPGSEQSNGSSSSASSDTCPECDNEQAYDATEYADSFGERLDPEHIDALEKGEWVCTDCGRVYG